MDPLMRWLWMRRAARAGIGITMVATALGIAWWLAARDAEERLPIATDAAFERALAREAERALREGPRADPDAISLRRIAEERSTPEPPRPAARYRPQPLDTGATPRRVHREALDAFATREVQRGRPQDTGNPRARFASGVQALAAPQAP